MTLVVLGAIFLLLGALVAGAVYLGVSQVQLAHKQVQVGRAQVHLEQQLAAELQAIKDNPAQNEIALLCESILLDPPAVVAPAFEQAHLPPPHVWASEHCGPYKVPR